MSKFDIGSYTLGLAVATGLIVGTQAKDKSNENSEIQNKIETTTNISAKDVNKIEQEVGKGQITWQQALDSLKTESAVKKAYFQGGQAVRDSLANAAKIAKKVKP